MALNRKIAYIDLTTGDIQTKPIPLEIRKKFLGGRGLDAYLLYNHTKKGCDPLGPHNTLLISGGILTATCASATARTHVMAKAPLTGGRSSRAWRLPPRLLVGRLLRASPPVDCSPALSDKDHPPIF